MDRYLALRLLQECTGNEIWSVHYCQQVGIPHAWIEELVECFESGFNRDSQTIYVQDAVVNQYEGLRDVDIAMKLGAFLGVEVEEIAATSWSKSSTVKAIREAVEEG